MPLIYLRLLPCLFSKTEQRSPPRGFVPFVRYMSGSVPTGIPEEETLFYSSKNTTSISARWFTRHLGLLSAVRHSRISPLREMLHALTELMLFVTPTITTSTKTAVQSYKTNRAHSKVCTGGRWWYTIILPIGLLFSEKHGHSFQYMLHTHRPPSINSAKIYGQLLRAATCATLSFKEKTLRSRHIASFYAPCPTTKSCLPAIS